MTTKMISCEGKIIQNKCRYEWKITNFDRCKTLGEYFESTEFSSHDNTLDWRLQLYPYGDKKENEGYISLYLIPYVSLDIKVKFRLTIDSNDYNTITKEMDREVESDRAWGYPQFCKRKTNTDSTQLLSNNLTVYCEFLDTDFLTLIENAKLETLKNMRQLLENKDFSDVTIKVGVKEFQAHKVILAAGSEVFAAMFKNEMIEKKTSAVEIENIDPEIFEQLLEFIYTGETKFAEETNKTLLVAADRYVIDGLKNICAHKLCKSISINNVIELLKFAEIYNVKILKDNAIDFIVTNAKNIINEPVFNDLKTVSSDILAEVFRRQNSSSN